MDFIQYIRTGSDLGHAYLTRAPAEETYALAKAALEERVGRTRNADVCSRIFNEMGIDDARAVAEFAFLKPLGERKYILLSFKNASIEAQHALLKVVEDGSGKSSFFFVVEPGTMLLPTLISRCVVLALQGGFERDVARAQEFLSLSYAERLGRAEAFAKEHDREGARSLVRSLLAWADGSRVSARTLRDLLEADHALQLSGSSPKSVIGHLALTL